MAQSQAPREQDAGRPDAPTEKPTDAPTEEPTGVAHREHGGEVEIVNTWRAMNVVKIDDVDLRAWDSVGDAMAAFEAAGMGVYLAHEVIGHGYQVVDKRELINAPLLIVSWRFTKSDTGDYVVCTAITNTTPARKVLFTDGSTGICSQLQQESVRRYRADIPHLNAGLLVPRGLTVSEYTVEGDDGQPKPARTYYLSTAPA